MPFSCGVVLPADPEEPEVEQPERARQHPAPGEAGGVQLTGDGSAGRRQAPSHLEHPGVLLAVTVLAPLRVVQVLAPAGGVGADRLQVPALVRADPDVRPRRRDRQPAAADPGWPGR